MSKYVALEGGIGVGKTTMARALGEALGWRVLEEPVDENFVLPHFYKDPKRYAFAMQLYLLHQRYRLQQVAAFDVVPCLLDRSLPGDRVFAKLHMKYGNIDEIEWRIYEHAFDSMCAVRPPFLIVYMDVQPQVALERLQRRGRLAEAGITLEYLQDLHDGYEDLMQEIESGRHQWSRGVEVLRVNWDDARDLAPAIDIVKRYMEQRR